MMQDLRDPEYWKSLINIGLSKLFVFKILYEGPSHGYGMLKKLAAMTGGCCVPTFGTIYPILKKMTDEGYARIVKTSNNESKRKRKIYMLTPKGEKTYKIALEAWRYTIPYIHKAVDFEYTEPVKIPLRRLQQAAKKKVAGIS